MHLPWVTSCVGLLSLVVAFWPFTVWGNKAAEAKQTLNWRVSLWIMEHWGPTIVASVWLIFASWRLEHGETVQKMVNEWVWPFVIGGVVGNLLAFIIRHAWLTWKRRRSGGRT